jgi:hypothetical protein
MSDLTAWLLSMVWPVLLRVMTFFGIGALTFTGVVELVNTVIQYAKDQWELLPVAVVQLAAISGVPQALGMVTAAVLAKLGIWSLAKATRFAFTGSNT